MADNKKASKSGKNKQPSNEQIVAGFNQLRQDQRALMTKIAELEGDQNEHRYVVSRLLCYQRSMTFLQNSTAMHVFFVTFSLD